MSSSFYTRGGDDGYTGLLGEGRVAKEDLRMEALGSIDEVTAALGVARSLARSREAQTGLIQVQRDLYGMMAEVAATPENAARFRTIDSSRVAWLEAQVDAVTALVRVPKEFILPGDTVEGAFFDLARVTVRRAERRVTALAHRGDLSNPDTLRYLNRLSSLLYVLELYEHFLASGAGGEKISFAKAVKEK